MINFWRIKKTCSFDKNDINSFKETILEETIFEQMTQNLQKEIMNRSS